MVTIALSNCSNFYKRLFQGLNHTCPDLQGHHGSLCRQQGSLCDHPQEVRTASKCNIVADFWSRFCSVLVWFFALWECPGLQGYHSSLCRQHGSLCDHPQRSEQPQNAKICSKLNKNAADFWSRFCFIFVWFFALWECTSLQGHHGSLCRQ